MTEYRLSSDCPTISFPGLSSIWNMHDWSSPGQGKSGLWSGDAVCPWGRGAVRTRRASGPCSHPGCHPSVAHIFPRRRPSLWIQSVNLQVLLLMWADFKGRALEGKVALLLSEWPPTPTLPPPSLCPPSFFLSLSLSDTPSHLLPCRAFCITHVSEMARTVLMTPRQEAGAWEKCISLFKT